MAKNWNSIEELQEIFIKRYKENGLLLEKACNEESEKKDDYNGRQILELLQNVDDACDGKASVKITYKNNLLEVENTGSSFSAETIERLCEGGVSNKSSERIGNKGTGFRSLLNNAEWIELHSDEFAIKFSKRYTEQLFNRYRNEPVIAERVKEWNKEYPICFPIMHCPEKIEKRKSEFDTLIRVKINDSGKEDIEKQLNQKFYRTLLFLPHINEIIVEKEDDKKIYKKEEENGRVRISKNDSDNPEEYFLFKKNVGIKEKKADLIIAVPKDDYDFENETLYCYFPIRNFPTPIHALIHAPFKTNTSRDDLPKDENGINSEIFIKLFDFIKECAEKLTVSADNKTAVQMVTTCDSKLWKENSFNLKKEYLEIIASAKILPTVNGEFISINDNPKILKNDFPEEFKGEKFKDLLICLNNQCIKFIQKLTHSDQLEITADEMIKRINDLSVNWDVDTRVKVFLWWSDYYQNKKNIPLLLKDTNGNWIEKNDDDTKIFLPADNKFSNLPKELSSWVNLRILDEDTTDKIIKKIKETDEEGWKKEEKTNPSEKRILSSYSKKLALKFTEQNSIPDVLKIINDQIDTEEKSCSFFKWVFDTYKDKLPDIDLKLPNTSHEIKPKTELYFGEAYGNPLADKLFDGTEFSPLISLAELYKGNLTDKKDELFNSLKGVGIVEYPKIEFKEEHNLKADFKNFIKEKYLYDKNINYIQTKKIFNFEKIIKYLSTDEIKEWINKDGKLKYLLKHDEENESIAMQQTNHRSGALHFPSNEYIKYILNTTPWIEIDGKKYSPSQIVKYEKLGNKLKDIGIYGISPNRLKKLLGEDLAEKISLGFADSMADFSDEIIEKILVTLPDINDPAKNEISRKMYLDLIEKKKEKKPSFDTSGLKVLAKDGEFYPNTEIKYADKHIHNEKNKKSNLIEIPYKKSTTTISNWLGVEKYKSNIIFEANEPYKHFDDFNEEINDIKVAILSIINKNAVNIGKIRMIEIIPCVELIGKDKEQQEEIIILEDYFPIEEGNNFYMKLPNADPSSLRQNDYFQSSVVDIFKQALMLELDQNAVENLVSRDRERKKKKIAEQYGSDAWEEAKKLLFNQEEINQPIYKFFNANHLEENLYEKIHKIDFSNGLSSEKKETLIEALKAISKDIDDLNKLSDLIDIDIRDYFVEKTKMLIQKINFKKYRFCFYVDAKNKGLEEQKLFLTNFQELEDYLPNNEDYNNSVYENIEKFLFKKFPVLKIENNESYDIDVLYDKNALKIRKDCESSDFDDFIQKNPDYKSLLYFDLSNEILNDICQKIKKKKEEEKSDNLQKDSDDDETGFSDQDENNFHIVKRKLVPREESQKRKKTRAGTIKSKRDYERQNKQNSEYGKDAERIAYKELKKTYPNLIWHSENSDEPAPPSDRNNPPLDNIVCDMWSRDAENTYFEVKAATDEFIMSVNEYSSMEKHPGNYEVVLVNIASGEISLHKFDELRNLRKDYNYIFQFNIKKEG